MPVQPAAVPTRDLYEVKSHEFTSEEARWHLRQTFDRAFRLHPDLMERYCILWEDAETPEQQVEVMRRGLRETFNQRYPLGSQTRSWI